MQSAADGGYLKADASRAHDEDACNLRHIVDLFGFYLSSIKKANDSNSWLHVLSIQGVQSLL